MPYKLLFGLYGIVDVSAYELSTFVPTTATTPLYNTLAMPRKRLFFDIWRLFSIPVTCLPSGTAFF